MLTPTHRARAATAGAAASRSLATVLASSTALLDATIANVALPHIADDLDAGVAGLQWVINGYLLTLASLILLGGALGDRFGRERVFVIGAVWFGVASLLCALAPNAHPADRGGCSRASAARCSRPRRSRSPRRASCDATGARRSARGPGSAASPARSARSWAGGWSTGRAGAGPSCSTCRSSPSRSWPPGRSPRAADETRPPTACRPGAVRRRRRCARQRITLAALTWSITEAPDRGWTDPTVVGAAWSPCVGAVAFVVRRAARARSARPLATCSRRARSPCSTWRPSPSTPPSARSSSCSCTSSRSPPGGRRSRPAAR